MEKPGLLFGTSKERKRVYMEMEKQWFVKQMFAGPSLTMGHGRTLIKGALLGSLLSATHYFMLT